MNEEILNNIDIIKERINKACKGANRNPDEVTIIIVGMAIFGQRIYSDSYYWNELKN